MAIRKRFIAGATCPSCNQPDSLQVGFEDGDEIVECVDCDYREARGENEPTTTSSKKEPEQIIAIFTPE